MRHPFSIWLLTACLLLCGGCELGQSSAGGGGGTGVEGLTGTLVDHKGAHASGAKVRVYPEYAVGLGNPKASLKFPKPDSTIADTDGRFAFRSMAPGTYTLVATLAHSDTALALHLTNVIVQEHTDLGIQILQATGSVLIDIRADGAPVVGARCRIPSSPFEAISDSRGQCTLHGLSPGVFRIEISASGFPTILSESVLVRSGMTVGLRQQLGSGSTRLPARVLTYSPPNMSAVIPGDSLRWSAVQGATQYELQVFVEIDTAFAEPLITHTHLTGTRHPVETSTLGTSYRWRVRAHGPSGAGPWSSVLIYSLAPPP